MKVMPPDTKQIICTNINVKLYNCMLTFHKATNLRAGASLF